MLDYQKIFRLLASWVPALFFSASLALGGIALSACGDDVEENGDKDVEEPEEDVVEMPDSTIVEGDSSTQDAS